MNNNFFVIFNELYFEIKHNANRSQMCRLCGGVCFCAY
ncbi:hypothetical protein FTUN_5866 [Frigoriglobus tundricola]|uniref:Uncharacterized protein n=1 Tax=Frigoriglobus tundricola TaxID=2774151 RepID=A0A6M5YWH5_9BACT|nr:hypothetical protein FTUN_5866 [Frigoriglobus tundricola]